jgi:electron-transferring-flavoprotein dehydrogenase
VSLANVTRWLGQQAESLGVEIFPGFPAAEILYNEQGAVSGVITGSMGIDKEGKPTDQFQLGMELRAKYTLFAEGSRGHLGKQLIAHFALDKDADPQSYGIGIKELWEVEPSKSKPGLVVHTAGWPLENDTYGGSFLYHLGDNKVAVGLVVGLSYKNPYLSPFEEFQRYKLHPKIRNTFEGGKRIAYGARALTAGGLNSLPKTVFPGGALIGCDAGFLNASRIKGSHAAIKTGMLAAEAAVAAINENRSADVLAAYPAAFQNSWLHTELSQARNFKPWMSKGLYMGTLMVGLEQKLLGGNMPWTIHLKHADHECLEPVDDLLIN